MSNPRNPDRGAHKPTQPKADAPAEVREITVGKSFPSQESKSEWTPYMKEQMAKASFLAAPQPAKSAQDNTHGYSVGCGMAVDYETKLPRISDDELSDKWALKWAVRSERRAQAELERVKAELALEQLQVKTNWEAYKEAVRLLDEAEQQRDELLEALKETTDALYNETKGHTDTRWIGSVKSKAQAAIARAEGRAG